MHRYQYYKVREDLVKVLNEDGEELKIETPLVSLPFGLESYTYKNKKNYFLKLEIDERFENKISTFEQYIRDKFSREHKKEYTLRSQLQTHDYYDTKLTVKVKQSFGKFTSKCIQNKREISFFEIQKHDTGKAYLTANVFFQGDTVLVKWSVDTLFLSVADNTS